jgi:hypothetical protein
MVLFSANLIFLFSRQLHVLWNNLRSGITFLTSGTVTCSRKTGDTRIYCNMLRTFLQSISSRSPLLTHCHKSQMYLFRRSSHQFIIYCARNNFKKIYLTHQFGSVSYFVTVPVLHWEMGTARQGVVKAVK